jgi:hypothetical protein
MWIFYDETNMAENYNIKKEGFIYYFLFAIVLIPFQVLIDGVFYTMIENYLKIDFRSFLIHLNQKFENRSERWKNTNKDHNLKLDRTERSIEASCFSSQMYFSNTIHLGGQIMIVLGVQTVISSNYNPFSDTYSFLICIFWWAVCRIIEKFFIFLANLIGVWSIGERKTIGYFLRKNCKHSFLSLFSI